MRIRMLLLLLIVTVFMLIAAYITYADCGPYGCQEPFTQCVAGECVSIKQPDPAPVVSPPAVQPVITDPVLMTIKRIYCGDKVCVVVIEPGSTLAK